MPKNPTADNTDETPENSRKREVTAAVTAAVVTVALGVVSTALIANVSEKIRNKIAPPQTTEDEK